MPPAADLPEPRHTSPHPIEIAEADAIAIPEALAIAEQQGFALGKSTLQRWAKYWYEHQTEAPVRCVLVTTNAGMHYKISRDDFDAWVFDQKQNNKSREVSQDLLRPHETPRDPMRPLEVSRDRLRPHTAAHGAQTSQSEFNEPLGDEDERKQLRDQNMQLRIDVEVRNQLLSRAREELTEHRKYIENNMRQIGALQQENGGLRQRLLQLKAPQQHNPSTEAYQSFADNDPPYISGSPTEHSPPDDLHKSNEIA